LLETFIIADDKVGQELHQALITAAEAGTRIEMMVDGYGTVDLSTPFISRLIDAGITIRVFDPSPRTLGMRTNLFRRLHRKIVVVDGEVAFVGGINFSAEQLSDFGDMAKQDYTAEVRGPIVADIRNASIELLREASLKNQRKQQAENFTLTENPVTGKSRIKIAVRDNNKHTSDIEKHYLDAILAAQERIVIANAYFFPGYRLLQALRNASRRGLEVILIMQGQPDMPWVSACSRLLYNYLLKEGVKIYEYVKRPLHGKVAVVDNQWTTVGSSNLDPLSLAFNLEANLFIEDPTFNQKLYTHLEQLVKSSCKPISLQRAMRGYWWRMPLIFICFHFARYFPSIAGWLPAHSPVLKPVRDVMKEAEESALINSDKEKTV
jgi:cardiolipin synthase